MSSSNGIGSNNSNYKTTSLPIRRTQSSMPSINLETNALPYKISASKSRSNSTFSSSISQDDQSEKFSNLSHKITDSFRTGGQHFAKEIAEELFDLRQKNSFKGRLTATKDKVLGKMQEILKRNEGKIQGGSEKLKMMGEKIKNTGDKIKSNAQEFGKNLKTNAKAAAENVKTQFNHITLNASNQTKLAAAKTNRKVLPEMVAQGGNMAMFLGTDPMLLAPKFLKNDADVMNASKNYKESCTRAATASKASVIARTKFLGIKTASGLGATAALTASMAGLGALVVALANRSASAHSASGPDDLPDLDSENGQDFSELASNDPGLEEALDSIFGQMGDSINPDNDEAAAEMRQDSIQEFKEVYNQIPAGERQEFLESFSSNALVELSQASQDSENLIGNNLHVFLKAEVANDIIDKVLQDSQDKIAADAENMINHPASQQGGAIGMGAAYGSILGASLGGMATVGLLAMGEQKIRNKKNEAVDVNSTGFQNNLLKNARAAHQDSKAARMEARVLFNQDLRPVIEQKLDARVFDATEELKKGQNPQNASTPLKGTYQQFYNGSSFSSSSAEENSSQSSTRTGSFSNSNRGSFSSFNDDSE